LEQLQPRQVRLIEPAQALDQPDAQLVHDIPLWTAAARRRFLLFFLGPDRSIGWFTESLGHRAITDYGQRKKAASSRRSPRALVAGRPAHHSRWSVIFGFSFPSLFLYTAPVKLDAAGNLESAIDQAMARGELDRAEALAQEYRAAAAGTARRASPRFPLLLPGRPGGAWRGRLDKARERLSEIVAPARWDSIRVACRIGLMFAEVLTRLGQAALARGHLIAGAGAADALARQPLLKLRGAAHPPVGWVRWRQMGDRAVRPGIGALERHAISPTGPCLAFEKGGLGRERPASIVPASAGPVPRNGAGRWPRQHSPDLLIPARPAGAFARQSPGGAPIATMLP